MNYDNIKFNVPRGQRLMLMLCVMVICLVAGAVLIALISGSQPTSPRVRIAAVVQDLVVFLVPALITAVVVTRRPADFLCLRRPDPAVTLWGLAALILAIPAMNMIIAWNESWPMPRYFSEAEAQAAETVRKLIGSGTPGGLVVTILIIGIMAPLCEELFFRGCMQRMLSTAGCGVHLANWGTAVIFSAVHFELAGLVPRILLGVLFGYLMVWSGSVWSAVAAHSLNNILAGITQWMAMRGDDTLLDEIGRTSWPMAAASAVLTVIVLIMCWRARKKAIPMAPADKNWNY